MSTPERLRVLHIEDNPGDVKLLEEAFREAGVQVEAKNFDNGEAAFEYFRSISPQQVAELPHLVILDLNIPRRDGRQVLSQIRRNPVSRGIPVCVFTSSRAEEDIVNAYELYANCYILKPTEFKDLVGVAKEMHRFWTETSVLPHR